MSFISFIYLIFLFFNIKTDDNDRLIFVMTHFRHGARAPQHFFNQAEYKDYIKQNWGNPGELTGVGQRSHYLLGLRNRKRYVDEKKFLSEKFDPHEILIYSSPFNRTIISVASQLQGLYPQYEELGDTIEDNQTEVSKPEVNIDDEEIQNEIKKLNRSALPYSMMLAPIRMININERKIILYDIDPCTKVRDEIKEKHESTFETIKEITKEFKDKYAETLNEFYGRKQVYNMKFLDNFCDAFISSYTHKREMTELNKTGLREDELVDFCFRYVKINFRDWVNGDKEHVFAHLESSKMMKEIIHYMGERIKADINKEKIEDKYEDYSRPKMMMISGHDSTVSCYQIFLLNALGKDVVEYYQYPKFTTQIAFEVTTTKAFEEEKTEDDYLVTYYFNDDPILNVTFPEFRDKIKPHIWTAKQIDNFCGFENDDEDDDDDDSNKALVITFISLTAFFFCTTLFLAIRLWKLKNSSHITYDSPLLTKSD